MSRYYQFDVKVAEYDQTCADAIMDALLDECNFDNSTDWWSEVQDSGADQMINVSGRSSLTAGFTEEQFAKRIARDVFKANDGPCRVNVRATYLGDLPFDEYGFGPDEYAELDGK